MKKILILAAVCIAIVIGGIMRVNAGLKKAPCNRGTDYKCMNDCISAGYMYSYCKKVCSY